MNLGKPGGNLNINLGKADGNPKKNSIRFEEIQFLLEF